MPERSLSVDILARRFSALSFKVKVCQDGTLYRGPYHCLALSDFLRGPLDPLFVVDKKNWVDTLLSNEEVELNECTQVLPLLLEGFVAASLLRSADVLIDRKVVQGLKAYSFLLLLRVLLTLPRPHRCLPQRQPPKLQVVGIDALKVLSVSLFAFVKPLSGAPVDKLCPTDICRHSPQGEVKTWVLLLLDDLHRRLLLASLVDAVPLLLLFSLFFEQLPPLVALFLDLDHHELFAKVNGLILKVFRNLLVVKSPNDGLASLLRETGEGLDALEAL